MFLLGSMQLSLGCSFFVGIFNIVPFTVIHISICELVKSMVLYREHLFPFFVVLFYFLVVKLPSFSEQF